MLNRIRVGQPTEPGIAILKSRPLSLLSKDDYEKAIHLFLTNLEVNAHDNKARDTLKA